MTVGCHADMECVDEPPPNDSTSSGSINVSKEDVINLIRLALAKEVSKRPLTREEIMQHVLSGSGRNLRSLINAANIKLEEEFAMKLVPLPARTRHISTQTVAGRRTVTAAQNTKPSTMGNNKYILLSSTERRLDGVAFHPNPARLGLLSVILTLIVLSGNELEEEILMEKLAGLSIDFPYDGQFGSIDTWIDELKKQKYIAADKKLDDPNVIILSTGPRAALEFPPERLAAFATDLAELVGRSDFSASIKASLIKTG